jgi:hypothetical protein
MEAHVQGMLHRAFSVLTPSPQSLRKVSLWRFMEQHML